MWTTEREKQTHKYYDNDFENGLDFIYGAEYNQQNILWKLNTMLTYASNMQVTWCYSS
jgi:hypothetical protein